MRKLRQMFGQAALLLTTSALIACGPPPQPVMTSINVPTFRVHDQPEITKEGLTVSVRPIMDDTVRSFPQIYQTVTYKAKRRQTNMFGQPDPTLPMVDAQGQAELSIIPLPSFKVQITNNTGHVLRFNSVVFRLQSGTGQSYSLYSGTAELVSWVENLLNTNESFGPEVANQVMPKLKTAINGLPLLNRNTSEMLNGDVWNGYLAFNMNVNSAKDYEDFLAATERLTLRLAEVPITYSDAGAVTKTTEFTFVIDKTTAPLRVKCPPGTQQPSISVCSKAM